MRFQNLPIKRKLVGIILLTTLSVLLLTCLALLSYEFHSYRQTTSRSLSTMAELIAANSTAVLIYDDQRLAQEILSGLRAEPDVVAAALFDRTGKIYATYPMHLPNSAFPSSPEPVGITFQNAYVTLYTPVIEGQKRVGTLFLKGDLGGMYGRLGVYGLVLLAVLTGSGVVALFLSNLFQKRISQPILDLAHAAKVVSERKDYSLRVTQTSHDELGSLTEAFNSMLNRIQESHSALQQAQHELTEHAQDLEKRVAERTAKLTDTIAELESFSYSISHDMRTPLRAMQGYADIILETHGEKMGPDGRQHLERIIRAARRMDSLIVDILTYSRLARSDVDLHPVDLQKLIEEIIQQFPGFQPPQADVQIEAPLAAVIGHEASLTQVITNLFSNAIKFVSAGRTPRLRVWTEPQEDKVRCWVEDNGIGIAQKDLHRIFGIFERVHPEQSYGGTGIGLSIVRKAVERMGGRTGVESELGKGSRFWFDLAKP